MPDNEEFFQRQLSRLDAERWMEYNYPHLFHEKEQRKSLVYTNIIKGLIPIPKKRWWHRQRYDNLQINLRGNQAHVFINGVLVDEW